MLVFLLFSSDFSTTLNPYFVIVTQHKNIVTETSQHYHKVKWPETDPGVSGETELVKASWKLIERGLNGRC